MKPIHIIASKDEMRPAMKHIQVKGGFVHATNAHALIKIPVKEVFGSDIVSDTDELYFDAGEWDRCKISKAVYISREGELFTAKDRRGLTIGNIRAKTTTDIDFRYPDFNAVLPTSDSPLVDISQIGLNPFILLDACKVFGEVNKEKFVLSFRGADKGIMISNIESEAICMVMPCLITNTEI